MIKNKVIRRIATGGLVFLFLGVVVLSFTGSVPGQYEIGGGDFLPVDPDAPGTRLHVTLTIQYLFVPDLDQGLAAGPFFMRIVKGDQTYPYSGDFYFLYSNSGVTLSDALCFNLVDLESVIPWDDPAGQTLVISDFFLNRVIPEHPELFPPLPSNKKYTVTLRSFGKVAQGGVNQDGDQNFAMLNLVVAVKAVKQ
jgi:hypothetical protein